MINKEINLSTILLELYLTKYPLDNIYTHDKLYVNIATKKILTPNKDIEEYKNNDKLLKAILRWMST